ncbi:MAG: hypothetical protein K6E56_00465 [Lachnospiraceae bacterium]|nr:hypothetical protein [Lachnospiraceae bacterium]
MDKKAVTIDGEDHLLRETAFYISYEEGIVQDQAIAYNSDNPIEYWNVHMNGNFIKLRAKEECMNMFIHDTLFYEMSKADGVELTAEETDYALVTASDYWEDLTDYARAGLGISENELTETIFKMAIAQKYQDIYAELNDLDSAELNVGQPQYEILLNNHKIKINGSVWDGLKFGEITIDQSGAKKENYEYFK